MAIYQQAVKGEKAVDNALTQTLRLEHSFTSTVRSLAPPRESGEKIFPGALYVLVASMAGSIVTRNRNILLRASVPLAVGITAANVVLPITSRNVGDLIWTYEEKYPRRHGSRHGGRKAARDKRRLGGLGQEGSLKLYH
jgi:organizing structure protein 2